MAELTTAAWLAGRSKFYGGVAAGKSEDRAKAEAIIEEYETMYGRFGSQSEREAAVGKALDAIAARSRGRTWTL